MIVFETINSIFHDYINLYENNTFVLISGTKNIIVDVSHLLFRSNKFSTDNIRFCERSQCGSPRCRYCIR